ncbi:MAG: hypothetical protein GY809_27935, partial [Planctomycetes bacterium]|nr:hypothetical protein [Planctomycetota bacterium]
GSSSSNDPVGNVLGRVMNRMYKGGTKEYAPLSKKDAAYNQGQIKAMADYSTKYEKMQVRRNAMPSMPDPDAFDAQRRKVQARKRMRGVLGTMLTQRESLG